MLLYLSAALVLITCITHSVVGEQRLIGPLLAHRAGPMRKDLSRQVLRFAWHLMSVLGLVSCYALIAAARNPHLADKHLVALIGVIFTFAGFFDAIYTRGRHIGWPLLTLSGLTALAALFLL